MRRSEKEINDPVIINSVFDGGDICRLGLVDGDSAYIVPMNFGYENGYLYFHSAGEGKKIELLKKDPMVSFEIELNFKIEEGPSACSWGASYLSLMGKGMSEFISDPGEKKRGLNIIMTKYSGKGDWDFSDLSVDETTIFRILVSTVSCKGSKQE